MSPNAPLKLLFQFFHQSLRLRLQRPPQRAAALNVSFGFREFALNHPRDAAIAEGVSQAWIALRYDISVLQDAAGLSLRHLHTSLIDVFPAAMPPDVRKRLCPSGDTAYFLPGYAPDRAQGGHSPDDKLRNPVQEVENLPHIRRRSREEAI